MLLSMTNPQSPSYWQQAVEELIQNDAIMAEIIARYPNEKLQGKDDAFHTLLRSITGQQISVVAADAIWGRLENQASEVRIQDSEENKKEGQQVDHSHEPAKRRAIGAQEARTGRNSIITPQAIRSLTEEQLRACGYSRMKVSYLHSLAEFFLNRQHLERDWAEMSDEEVVKDITQIKGIGLWTAEMFLMFHLLRPNILPLGDIGLLNGVAKHYHEGERKSLPQVTELAEKWQPWRSVATWYLWRSLDDVAVAY